MSTEASTVQVLPASKALPKTARIKVSEDLFLYIALPVLILILWEILARLQIFPPALLPPVEKVVSTFIGQIQNGELFGDVSISLLRVIKGYSLAVLLGITFGVLMGISLRTNKFFTIVFDGIRQIPPLAWIPLIILWFGIGEVSKVVIIVKSAFFPILLNTINGIRATPKSYIEVAQLYNISKFDLFKKVYFPAAIPSIFVGLRLSLGAAWMTVVAAELIAASSGIGYRINDARTLMASDLVMVGMAVIGTIGILMDLALKRIARRFTKWQAS